MAEEPEFTKLTVKAALNHVQLLKEFDEKKEIHQPHILHNAIRRYETCWLPLMAKHGSGGKGPYRIPPLDVAWIWHIHMLAPLKYHEDCRRILGSVLDNSSRLEISFPAQNDTEFHWKGMNPTEPYEIKDYSEVPLDIKYEQKSGYNLMAAAERQREFYYNVSLPHYWDDKFLTQAIGRYKKFMKLKKIHSTKFLVPMYDIDLVWHTHQLLATAYKEDCEAYFGHIIHHDDSTTDRSEGSQRNRDEAETKRLWFEEFGTTMAIPGTMYRGKSTAGRMNDFNDELFENTIPWQCEISIDELEFNSSTKLDGKITAGMSVYVNGSKTMNLSDLGYFKTKSGHYVWNHETVAEGRMLPAVVPIIVSDQVSVKITLTQTKGIPYLTKTRKAIHAFSLDLTDVAKDQHNKFKTGGHYAKPIIVESDLQEKGERKFKLTCVISKFKKLDTKLKVKQDQGFENKEFGKDFEDVWGPVPLHHLTSKDIRDHPDVRFAQQSIAVTSNLSGSVLTSRVIHSLPLKMSAIHVMQDSKLVAISHLVGLDQLPQVDKKISGGYPMLDTKRGDRAMLIKNNKGDWGLLIAYWEGYKKAVKGYNTRKKRDYIKTPGNSGYLHLSFIDLTKGHGYKLPDSITFYDKSGSSSRNMAVSLAEMELTMLQGGQIKLSPDCKDVAENVALALSVITLFILCEPRNKITITSMTEPKGYKATKYKATKGSKSRVHYYGSEDPYLCSYFCYFGYDEEIPSNCHLFMCHKHRSGLNMWLGGSTQEDSNRTGGDAGVDVSGSGDIDDDTCVGGSDIMGLYDPCTSDYFSESEGDSGGGGFAGGDVGGTDFFVTSSSDNDTSGGGYSGSDTGYSSSSGGGGSSCGSSCASCAASCASSSGGGGGSSCVSSSGGGGGSSCGSSCGGGGSSCGSSCGSSD